MQNLTSGDDRFWHIRYLPIHSNRVLNLDSGLGPRRGGVALLAMQETVIGDRQ